MDLEEAVLTVDVEDGINLAMRDIFGKEMLPTNRVVRNTHEILNLFNKYQVKATFFILGQIAEHYPGLIREIDRMGHEIGIHGYDHYQFFRMDKKFARDQLSRAKDLIENIIDKEIKGHRAPAFSINESTKWGLELLAKLGFKYDSSIMPCKSVDYGWEGFPKDICRIKIDSDNSIYEMPMSTINILGRDVPTMGGSYFRLLPYWFTEYSFKKVAKQRHPVFYLHPYEIDTEKYPDYYYKELQKKSLTTNLKMRSMWLRRNTVSNKIEKLLKNHSFVTMESILSQAVQKQDIPDIKL